MSKEVKRWITVNGRHIPLYDEDESFSEEEFKEHAEEYVAGGIDVDDVFTMQDLDYIRDHQEETDKPLYRVEDMKYTAQALYDDEMDGDDFKFGDTFRSFTSDFNFLESAMNPDSDNYAAIRNPVIFEIVGTKKHFDMDPYTKTYSEMVGCQSESLVGGRFEVVEYEGMRKVNGKFVPVIVIQQKGR